MRTVYCDFCHAVLSDHAWDCPTEDFDYDEQRVGLDADATPVDGSVGSWLACDDCAYCVRNGLRQHLARRSLLANYGTTEVAPERVADIFDLHGQFWAHRRGKPIWVGKEQIALIASDPATLTERQER